MSESLFFLFFIIFDVFGIYISEKFWRIGKKDVPSQKKTIKT